MKTNHSGHKASITSLVAAVGLLFVGAGSAQAEFSGWGPRVGVTLNPDQIHFGGHLDFRTGSRMRIQPNLEVGVGDDLTLLAFNVDAAYRFRERWDVWTPYLGGGIGLNMVSDDDHGVLDGSSSDAGLNVLGGIEKGLSGGSRFFIESKFGLIDAPDVKFTVGWTFAP